MGCCGTGGGCDSCAMGGECGLTPSVVISAAPAGMSGRHPAVAAAARRQTDVMISPRRKLSDFGSGMQARPAGSLPGGLTQAEWDRLTPEQKVALIDRQATSDTARNTMIAEAVRSGATDVMRIVELIVQRDRDRAAADSARAAQLEQQRIAIEKLRLETAAKGGIPDSTGTGKDGFDGAGASTSGSGTGTGPFGEGAGSTTTGGTGSGPLGGTTTTTGTTEAAGMSTTTKWLIAAGVVGVIGLVWYSQKKKTYRNPYDGRPEELAELAPPAPYAYAQRPTYYEGEAVVVYQSTSPYGRSIRRESDGRVRDEQGRYTRVAR